MFHTSRELQALSYKSSRSGMCVFSTPFIRIRVHDKSQELRTNRDRCTEIVDNVTNRFLALVRQMSTVEEAALSEGDRQAVMKELEKYRGCIALSFRL
jgi:hypothetical protein